MGIMSCSDDRRYRMNNNDAFSKYHPIVNFFYFLLVLICSMFFMHPLFIAVSFVSALPYSILLKGSRAVKFTFAAILPMALIAIIINFAFNHEGATILTYFSTGNPLTLESILYGAAAGLMLATVITWFSCLNEVITSDKLMYLFGRIVPTLSLTFSMVLRFIPKFIGDFKTVSTAQRCIGHDVSRGSFISKIKSAVIITSVVITRSLENAIDTADSMKSRGYGLRGRTAFSYYRFTCHDRNMFIWLLLCTICIAYGRFAGMLDFRYYPTLKGAPVSVYFIVLTAVYLLMCITPLIINLMEAHKWKHLQSEI